MANNDPYTKDGYVRFTLRIPDDLMEELKGVAAESKRSTGKQIEYILDCWLNDHHKDTENPKE